MFAEGSWVTCGQSRAHVTVVSNSMPPLFVKGEKKVGKLLCHDLCSKTERFKIFHRLV